MTERNTELAAFLRSRRRRLTPEQVGLQRAPHRRTAALRREEVAWLADVGITWYTWLEQGRRIKIASGTLGRIADALRLDSSESEYLDTLVHSNGNASPPSEGTVPASLRALLASYDVGYAFVVGPRWDIIASNPSFARLFRIDADDGQCQDLARNALWMMFTSDRCRRLFSDWDTSARRMVAVLRMGYGRYVGERGFEDLIGRLSRTSDAFSVMWSSLEVLTPTQWTLGDVRDPASGRLLHYESACFPVPEAPDQMLVFSVPACCLTSSANLAEDRTHAERRT